MKKFEIFIRLFYAVIGIASAFFAIKEKNQHYTVIAYLCLVLALMPYFFNVKVAPGTTSLVKYEDNFVAPWKVTKCCKTGPITNEKYCPNCGKKIIGK